MNKKTTKIFLSQLRTLGDTLRTQDQINLQEIRNIDSLLQLVKFIFIFKILSYMLHDVRHTLIMSKAHSPNKFGVKFRKAFV